jgi:hypothetical protein
VAVLECGIARVGVPLSPDYRRGRDAPHLSLANPLIPETQRARAFRGQTSGNSSSSGNANRSATPFVRPVGISNRSYRGKCGYCCQAGLPSYPLIIEPGACGRREPSSMLS